MTSIERTAYPRFKRLISAGELHGHFKPTREEVSWASQYTDSDGHLLALVLALKCFQWMGRFPKQDEIPGQVVDFVRRALKLPGAVVPVVASDRSAERHRGLIRTRCGVSYNPVEARRIAADAIRAEAEVKNNPADLINVALEKVLQATLELPAYRTHLQAVAKRAPRTVNNALAAVDDFYTRRGLGAANATRADLPKSAPRALSRRTAVRFLRAVEQRPSPRDQALALIPFYAGARIAETVGLDVDDVKISARKGTLRVLGKGEKVREVPLHPALRAVLADWLAERGDWPGAHGAALFLNQRGGRLSARGAGDIITAIATDAHLDGEGVSAHPLRHTFVTTLSAEAPTW